MASATRSQTTQEPLRRHFSEKLEDIRSGTIRMGSYAHEMVRRSVEATINGDQELANQVIAEDDEVDRMERRILDQAVLTVMQEQPVAKDLLLLISTIGVVSEIEKVADHAVKLCRRSRSLQRTFPAEMKLALQEMGESARREFSSALRLYSAFTAELAEEVIHGDDAVDERYQEARSDLMQLIRQHPESTEYLVQSIEAFHALEHVADHAVAIAVRLKMVYSSGELKSSFES